MLSRNENLFGNTKQQHCIFVYKGLITNCDLSGSFKLGNNPHNMAYCFGSQESDHIDWGLGSGTYQYNLIVYNLSSSCDF